jgi:hypothetical protein
VGRPSLFTAELAAAICERISLGESLRSICRDEKMPAKSTVFEWLSQDAAFADQYARARESSADVLAEEILEIADDATNDWMERNAEDNAGWVANGEHIQRSRLRVDTRKWIAAKLKPKKYGERQTVEHEGAVNLNVVQVPLPAGGINEWLALTSSGSPAADPSSSS